MAINYHQPSVNALFDAMPWPILTFGVNGLISYANKAAKVHPGKPVDAMSGKPVIKSLVRDVALNKVKLPYKVDVELADGNRVAGMFMAGPSGLDIAFVIQDATEQASRETQLRGLPDIIALLRDEVGPPLRKLSGLLGSLPESPELAALEEAAGALDQRLRRLVDLIAVFGDEVLITTDRIELSEVVQSVCAELTPRATAKKVLIQITEPSQVLPPIYGNANLIRRAFFECFDNAITHSRREVNSQQQLLVKVAYTLTGEHVLITVRNLGAIPEEERGVETRDVFTKSPNLPANDTKGRLGLPLVSRIVGLHGGNIRVAAMGDDETRVMMEFPTGAPLRGQAQLDIAQAQRYAADLAQLMSRRKKEAA